MTKAKIPIIMNAPLSQEYKGILKEIMIYQLVFIKTTMINFIAL
jgi:hypothetical protein